MNKEPSSAYKDGIGGVHDCGLGWNPNGHFCGECSYISCADCRVWRPSKRKLQQKKLAIQDKNIFKGLDI